MVMVTVVEPMQLEPDPNAPLQVWTPDDKEVIAPDPKVPPLPIVVCPDRWGNAAMPDDGVIADGVTSPIVTASVSEKADPAKEEPAEEIELPDEVDDSEEDSDLNIEEK